MGMYVWGFVLVRACIRISPIGDNRGSSAVCLCKQTGLSGREQYSALRMALMGELKNPEE